MSCLVLAFISVGAGLVRARSLSPRHPSLPRGHGVHHGRWSYLNPERMGMLKAGRRWVWHIRGLSFLAALGVNKNQLRSLPESAFLVSPPSSRLVRATEPARGKTAQVKRPNYSGEKVLQTKGITVMRSFLFLKKLLRREPKEELWWYGHKGCFGGGKPARPLRAWNKSRWLSPHPQKEVHPAPPTPKHFFV